MCAGSLLANRELYATFMRLFCCLKIEPYDEVDWDPVSGVADPSAIASMPCQFRARFVPRDSVALGKALQEY